MIRLSGRLPDNAGYALLRQLLHVREKSIALAALEGLLSGKQAIDSALVRPIAADRARRLELFRLLDKAGRINLLPAAYRTQKALGQSEVYAYLDDDDDLDDNLAITYVTSRMINTPQGKKNVLFYKYGSDDAVHLACAGPYAPGKLGTSDIRVAVNYHEAFDSSKLREQVDSLLKRFVEENVDAKTPRTLGRTAPTLPVHPRWVHSCRGSGCPAAGGIRLVAPGDERSDNKPAG